MNLHLETIKLTNFKNYESANLTFSPQLNAFVGLNGTGKTNLLDAIYYACMCKSYFLATDSDVILRGSDFLRVDAVFHKQGKRERIVAKAQARKRKIFERNDVAYAALSDHIGLLPVVMIAPDDTDLIKEGSEERRRFVDNALSQLDNLYLRHLMFYNKIVEQRNAALKKWSDSEPKNARKQEVLAPDEATEGSEKSNWDYLIDTYDSQLMPSVAYIFEKRQAFIVDFEPIFNHFYKKITDERETVSIVYESQLLTDTFPNLLRRNREKDRYLQRTSVGIHRDNLSFEMDGKPIRKFGSQGQLKSFVIALKLAQYHILRIKNLKFKIKGATDLDVNANKLNTNTNELNVNANELNVNANELNTNINELNTNVNELNTNVNELNTNVNELNTNVNELNTNVNELNTNANELNTNANELNTNTNELNVNANELHTNTNELNTINSLQLRNNLDDNNELELEDKILINNALNTQEALKINAELVLNTDLNTYFELELRTELEINSALALNKELALTRFELNKQLALNSLELSDKPLLLLDDIFDKLDEKRVQNLVQLIVSQQFGQIFITDTHIERIEKLGADLGINFKTFEVENGTIKLIVNNFPKV